MRFRPLVFLSLMALVPAAPCAARADTVTLTPLKDNTLFEDATGSLSNGAGPAFYCGRIRIDPGPTRRGLIAFDVSALPTDVVIDSVSLELELGNSAEATPRLIRIYRALADWGEGTSTSSGGGAAATTGDATWLHTFYPDAFWSKPGGDFASVASDSLEVNGPGAYVWKGAGLASDVHGWTSKTSPNFGWLILGDESTAQTARAFDSRTGAVPPRLVIHYSVATPVKPTTWGKIKQIYR